MSREIDLQLPLVDSYPLALEIIQKLNAVGHTSYFAGGCVRDALLGKVPKDIDIATTAHPDEVERHFSHTVAVGKKFGIIVVIQGRHSIEVATFRKESDYRDGRRPEHIEYSGPEEDSIRRDFTMNALFYDPVKKSVIDFQNGISDIENKILRCVGNADKRFSEDYLRILRCFRFGLVLGLKIEEATLQSALRYREGLRQVSQERKREELLKTSLNLKYPWQMVCVYSTHKLWMYYGLPNEILDYHDYLFSAAIDNETELLTCLLWSLSARINIKSWLKEFKCSTEVRQQVVQALDFKNNILSILNWSDEDMHMLSYKSDLRWLINILKTEIANPFYKVHHQQSQINQKLDRLSELMRLYAGKDIKPIVNGDDLKMRFQGVELGRVLDLLFRKQLVFQWTRKEDALRWLDTQAVRKG
ncbi:MAG: hypothetical protein JNL11_05425 [Bdellovibrionaceae bacterium]|nr:hypothetical protein [Pseudobdellovibrionaceae bacterium]